MMTNEKNNSSTKIPHLKYIFRYLKFVKSRNKRDKRFQEHHVIPKYLGGTDLEDNLVYLTPKDHFHAHYLLMFALRTQKSQAAYNFTYGLCLREGYKVRYKNPPYCPSDGETKIKMSGKRGPLGYKRKSPMNGREPLTDEQKTNISNGRKGKGEGKNNGNCDKETWKREKEFYKIWVENGKPGWKRLCTLAGSEYKKAVGTMIKHWKRDEEIV